MLQYFYKAQTKKDSQQIQIMTEDIEDLKKTLTNSKKAEDQRKEEEKKQQLKLVLLNQENEQLLKTILELEKEVRCLNKICLFANHELRHTPQSPHVVKY